MVNNIDEKIINIIKDVKNKEILVDIVSVNSKINDIGINSIDFIKIVLNIEKEFGFRFNGKNLDYTMYSTVGDIAVYVRSKI